MLKSFGRQQFEAPCPYCRLSTWVTFDQVLRREFAICRGCHANILLDDHMGTVRQAVRRLDQIFSYWPEVFE